MRAMEIQGAYGIDNLKLADRPVPKAGPGQVVIRMKAASLNFRDLATVSGTYGPGHKLPLVLGSWWAYIPSTVIACLFIYRTHREDRMLQDGLAGYPEYAQDVRYRLVPGIW